MSFQGEKTKDVLFQTFGASIGTPKPLILSSISKNLEDSSFSIEKSKEETRQMAGGERVVYEDSDSVFAKLPEGMHLNCNGELFANDGGQKGLNIKTFYVFGKWKELGLEILEKKP